MLQRPFHRCWTIVDTSRSAAFLGQLFGLQRHQHPFNAISMAPHLLDEVRINRGSLNQLHFEALGMLVEGFAVVVACVDVNADDLTGDWRGSRGLQSHRGGRATMLRGQKNHRELFPSQQEDPSLCGKQSPEQQAILSIFILGESSIRIYTYIQSD